MTRENSESMESLAAKCARFSAQPPNERPLDTKWDEYARDPDAAYRDFKQYLPEYGHVRSSIHEREGISGKLRVAAAFGGIILAAEAGDPRAKEAYRQIRADVREVGRAIVNTITQSISERYVVGAGSALGVYLAASAADSPGHTTWDEGARPRPEGSYTQRSDMPQAVRDNDSPQDIALLGLLRLNERYFQGRLLHQQHLLVLGYADVVEMTGALPALLQNPNDKISAQRIEDFVGSCLRLAGIKDLQQPDAPEITSMAVSEALTPRLSDMFRVGAQLLRMRNVPVKGGELDPQELEFRAIQREDDERWNTRLDELFGALARRAETNPIDRDKLNVHLSGLLDDALNFDKDMTAAVNDLPIDMPAGTPESDSFPIDNETDPANSDQLRPFLRGNVPTRPNDHKWRRLHGGAIYTRISGNKILRIYQHPSSSRESNLPISLITPEQDTLDIGPHDIVMVYEMDKDKRAKAQPSHVFQGVDQGLPNGFTALDTREPTPIVKPAPHNRMLRTISNGLARLVPQSRRRSITEVRSITSRTKSYVIYPALGRQVNVIAPDGELLQGRTGDGVVITEQNGNGEHLVVGLTTLGDLAKSGDFYYTL